MKQDVDKGLFVAHLELLQSIIARMSEDSRSIKTWSVSLVSAGMVIGDSSGRLCLVLPSLIAMFALLDSYYLSNERIFRSQYNDCVQKFHSNQLKNSDVLIIPRPNLTMPEFIDSIWSKSIFFFYLALFILTFLITLA